MKVTVILSSYNHEKFIKASIESILRQTYREFEFIIVDDCSSDSSWEIICQYKKEYPEIITIRHDYNWGSGVLENTVKNYATGDYIAIHHSDDIWDVDKLQKQVEILQSNDQYVAVFTNAEAINDNGEAYVDKKGFYYNLFSVENRSRHEWLNYFFYKGNCLCHPSVLIRKDVYMEDGFFRKGLRQIPDYIKWIQVCKKHEIYVLQEPLVKFRIHGAGENMSGMRAETQIRSTIELFLMLNEYSDIKDKEELLKIFPETRKYCTDTFFSAEYAFGRLCMQEEMPSYTRLFGSQLLYRVLNQPDVASQIEKECRYTKKDYIEDNGKRDVFGIVPKAFEQMRTVYIDTGNGFCAEGAITERFTFENEKRFEMVCGMELREGQALCGIRFDPAENVMIRSKLEKVLVNGQKAEYIGENALCNEDGREIFVNLDPIYHILLPEDAQKQKKVEIVIAGKMERLTDEDINTIVTRMMYDNRELQYQYRELQYQYQEKCKRLDQICNTRSYQISDKLSLKLSGKHLGEPS